jgi:NADPH:quinone reductase
MGRKDGRMTHDMRAVVIDSYGAPLELRSIPVPTPAEDQELVEVVYASVNPLDIWVCQGNFAGVTPLPHVPGSEGLVRRSDGSLAIVLGVGVAGPGAYAQQLAAPTASLTSVPDGIDPQQAAGLGVAGVTAWMCVHSLAAVGASDTVLVLGASGGVGSVAAQLARLTGATVLGQTSSAAKVGAVEALGVAAVLAPTAADLGGALGGAVPTVVIEGLGGGFTGAAVEVLGPRGRLVNFGTSAGSAVQIDMRVFYRKGTRMLGYGGLLLTPDERSAAFAGLFGLVRRHELRVPIDSVLPLGGAAEAHQRILDKAVEGKILLDAAQ